VRGTLIKKTRLALALSMEALARAAELTAETVSRAETGGPVAEVSAAKIAKALRMELDEIRFS
jgi:transcriptional regulator with XRE-family HTH domain